MDRSPPAGTTPSGPDGAADWLGHLRTRRSAPGEAGGAGRAGAMRIPVIPPAASAVSSPAATAVPVPAPGW